MPKSVFASLSFDEAIKYFQNKLNLPTETWQDIWQGMHTRAFVVAGVTRADMLVDFHEAVEKAISDGTTLREFRKTFDDVVERTGWVYKGGRNWRSRVIYETNIRTSYAAGRYQQMHAPDMLKRRPYWEYRHGDSVTPRPEHLAWDGLILPADDPWWNTHYPPNGWGCKCKVFALSDRDLKKMGKTVPDKAPYSGTYEWTDNKGKAHIIPNGIDPGWAYNVGKSTEMKPDLSKYPSKLRQLMKAEGSI